MSRKTNKTSHVMDLLTNGASPETDTPVTEAVSGQDKKSADVQSHTVSPAKVTVVDEGSRNDRLSQEILGKLTEELEEETRQELKSQESENEKPEMDAAADADESSSEAQAADNQAPQAREADTSKPEDGLSDVPDTPVPESAGQELQTDLTSQEPADGIQNSEAEISQDIPQTPGQDGQSREEHPQSSSLESPQNSGNASEPAQSQTEASEPAAIPGEESRNTSASPKEAEKTKAAPKKEPHPIIPESQFDSRFQDKEYRFLNVMEQLLMRQNLDAVLTQYEVCTCPRCMSDVCALALTGLPAKYVVTSKDSISPLISYYENKYKIPVLTELMKACNKVRQNPRHKVQK